jgi:hypothetical protein
VVDYCGKHGDQEFSVDRVQQLKHNDSPGTITRRIGPCAFVSTGVCCLEPCKLWMGEVIARDWEHQRSLTPDALPASFTKIADR